MSRQANHDRDPRWDGWPIAAEGVALPNYPVIDPTDPDWVGRNQKTGDVSDEDVAQREEIFKDTIENAVESYQDLLELGHERALRLAAELAVRLGEEQIELRAGDSPVAIEAIGRRENEEPAAFRTRIPASARPPASIGPSTWSG